MASKAVGRKCIRCRKIIHSGGIVHGPYAYHKGCIGKSSKSKKYEVRWGW